MMPMPGLLLVILCVHGCKTVLSDSPLHFTEMVQQVTKVFPFLI